MLTDILDRLRAATEGTTPGPWDYNARLQVGPLHDGDDQAWGMICDPVAECYFSADYLRNARFIADARSLVPEAADTIAALRAEVEALKAQVMPPEPTDVQIRAAIIARFEDVQPGPQDWLDEWWQRNARVWWRAIHKALTPPEV